MLLGIPSAIFLMHLRKKSIRVFFFFLLPLTLFPNVLSIYFYSIADTYKIATPGFEIHAIDLICFSMLIHMLLNPSIYPPLRRVPLKFSFIFFLLIAIASWCFTSPMPGRGAEIISEAGVFNPITMFEFSLYPLFEISKILRGAFIAYVVMRFLRGSDEFALFLQSASCTACIALIWALWSRYIDGVYRVTLLTEHVNVLNTHLAVLGSLFLPFVFQSPRLFKGIVFLFLWLASLVVIVLTVSRSALIAYLFAAIVSSGISLIRFFSLRTLLLNVLSWIFAGAILFKAAGTLYERFFIYDPTAGAFQVRERMNEAAVLMANDHLFGVGLGNFSGWSLLEYSNLTGAEAGNMAHNIFYLTLGELGYLGLLSLILLFCNLFFMCFKTVWRTWPKRYNLEAAYAIGFLAAVTACLFQNFFHYSLRTTASFLVITIYFGALMREYCNLKFKTDY
jgi:O-antigen ligase